MADLNDALDSGDDLDSILAGSQSSVAAAPSYADIAAAHSDLLSSLRGGTAQPVSDSEDRFRGTNSLPTVTATTGELGTPFLLPSEMQSGRDFLTGKPLVDANGQGIRNVLQPDVLGVIQAPATAPRLSPLPQRRDLRYNAIQPMPSPIAPPSAGKPVGSPVQPLTPNPLVAPSSPGQYAPISLSVSPFQTLKSVNKSLYPTRPSSYAP